MSDRVLPAGLAALVEGEVLGDVLVDPAQGQPLLPGRLNRHRYQRRVRVRRPHQPRNHKRDESINRKIFHSGTKFIASAEEKNYV